MESRGQDASLESVLFPEEKDAVDGRHWSETQSRVVDRGTETDEPLVSVEASQAVPLKAPLNRVT